MLGNSGNDCAQIIRTLSFHILRLFLTVPHWKIPREALKNGYKRIPFQHLSDVFPFDTPASFGCTLTEDALKEYFLCIFINIWVLFWLHFDKSLDCILAAF